jgi:hypothetical protein
LLADSAPTFGKIGGGSRAWSRRVLEVLRPVTTRSRVGWGKVLGPRMRVMITDWVIVMFLDAKAVATNSGQKLEYSVTPR